MGVSNLTDKVIARHTIAEHKGQRIVDPSHRKVRPTSVPRHADIDQQSGAGCYCQTFQSQHWFYEAVCQRLGAL